MTDFIWDDKTHVSCVKAMASDEDVIAAAKVSNTSEVLNAHAVDPYRFINVLMSQRHGSPFEHTSFVFHIETPIFVAREWFTHRIGSFNEYSGRYSVMKPRFYIPNFDRPVVNVGTSMKPEFAFDVDEWGKNTPWRQTLVQGSLKSVARSAWKQYQACLDEGVAREVSRMCLPLNIYTNFRWTVNARSLMNFLSLRVQDEQATYVSHPLYEIHQAAVEVEKIFAEAMPHTHQSFVNNGRVAP